MLCARLLVGTPRNVNHCNCLLLVLILRVSKCPPQCERMSAPVRVHVRPREQATVRASASAQAAANAVAAVVARCVLTKSAGKRK